MTPDQVQMENAEAERAANLLCSAIRECFYHGLENPHVYPPESALTPLSYHTISGAGADLIVKYTGCISVLVNATGPIQAWIPQRLVFQVHPEYAAIWKATVEKSIDELYAEIRDTLSEAPEEEVERTAVEPEVLPPSADLPPTVAVDG